MKRKKKRRINLLGFSILFLLFSSFLCAGVKLAFKQYNNYLAGKEQDFREQIRIMEATNQEIALKVADMSDSDRVRGITQDSGLNYLQNNIVIITSGN